jgi:hypothetical protein
MKRRLQLTLAVAVAVVASTASVAQAAGSRIGAGSGGSLRQEIGCTADATKALVRTFVRDYNNGRVAALDRLWAPEPRFQWFSTGPPGARLASRAYERATLAAYFRTRVHVHERIRLTELRAGYDPNRNIVNFSGKLVRSADDLRPRPPHNFKGAAECYSAGPTLIVWSM